MLRGADNVKLTVPTGWEGGQIFGDVDTGLAKFEELDLLLLLPGAKNEPERRVPGELLPLM